MYKYIARKDEVYQTTLKGVFFDEEWLKIYPDGTIIIPKGYAHDGCSPKFIFKDLIFGTPDGRTILIDNEIYAITEKASRLHDAFYQYKETIHTSRYVADVLFYEELAKVDFEFKEIYYNSVRLFGGLYGSWNIK